MIQITYPFIEVIAVNGIVVIVVVHSVCTRRSLCLLFVTLVNSTKYELA